MVARRVQLVSSTCRPLRRSPHHLRHCQSQFSTAYRRLLPSPVVDSSPAPSSPVLSQVLTRLVLPPSRTRGTRLTRAPDSARWSSLTCLTPATPSRFW